MQNLNVHVEAILTPLFFVRQYRRVGRDRTVQYIHL